MGTTRGYGSLAAADDDPHERLATITTLGEAKSEKSEGSTWFQLSNFSSVWTSPDLGPLPLSWLRGGDDEAALKLLFIYMQPCRILQNLLMFPLWQVCSEDCDHTDHALTLREGDMAQHVLTTGHRWPRNYWLLKSQNQALQWTSPVRYGPF